MFKRLCQKCGKEYYVRWIKSTAKFCNHSCYIESIKGVKRPKISEMFTGSGNPRWKGGRILDKDGYWMIYSPKHPFKNAIGYVREHRLVMEKFLGRYLMSIEVIHHKDENKQNNKLSNLQLFFKPDHDRLSLKLRNQRIK